MYGGSQVILYDTVSLQSKFVILMAMSGDMGKADNVRPRAEPGRGCDGVQCGREARPEAGG